MAPKTLAEALEGWEDQPALFPVGRAKPITRQALKDAVFGLAKTLQQSGIQKGDVVSIAEANTVSTLMLSAHSGRCVTEPCLKRSQQILMTNMLALEGLLLLPQM